MRNIALAVSEMSGELRKWNLRFVIFINVKQNTYQQYESGKRQLPIEALIKLAKYYNLSADYILGLIKEPEPLKRKK